MAKFTKAAAFASKVYAFVKSPQGKRDVALVVATGEALYQAAKQLGLA